MEGKQSNNYLLLELTISNIFNIHFAKNPLKT